MSDEPERTRVYGLPTWLDGTPTEAAYRQVAFLIESTSRMPPDPFSKGAIQTERWKAIAAELERIRLAMWNAGTVNLPEAK